MVGLGPGGTEFLTPRAQAALAEAQVIIGYKTYINLIKELVADKEVHSSGMRKEIDRAREAVHLAQEGLTVAVVSSGDPGVYGMAGIILELSQGQVAVEVIPGVTAATAAAAVLGAPLMHDFAVISLSDLLTPWETIARRLKAAAQADFIIVLYNPKSRGRSTQIARARDIIKAYRQAQTPVGIVRNALRPGQEKVYTTLGDMLTEDIDMFATVVIGNSQTRLEHGYMVTPRGYPL